MWKESYLTCLSNHVTHFFSQEPEWVVVSQGSGCGGSELPGYCVRIESMKVREVIEFIEADGWYLVATRGSHRQYKHPDKPGRITIPGKLSDTLPHGTMNSIWKQAGYKEGK